jgi:hypothetical protein
VGVSHAADKYIYARRISRQDLDLLEASALVHPSWKPHPCPTARSDLDPVLSKDTMDYHYEHLAKGYAKRYNAGEGNENFNRAGSFCTTSFSLS